MADTKNYGLKGVGDDVQFGKAGGRFVFNTGTSDFRATTDGTTLSHLQVLTPVGDTDAATKLYVDTTALGLDFKESCRCATTATTGTYNSTGGTAANGQLTAVAVSIDGITLAQGDRVLIKDHGTSAANGIYEVQATTTTLNRATDSDSNAEVTAGNFTFIEEGTVNRNAGYVLQGPDPLTVGTGGGSDMVWVLFSASSDILAGDALTKTGNTLNLDFVGGGGLTNATATAGGDFIAFSDTTGGDAMFLRSWTNVLADLDIVNLAFGSGGILTQTAADTYAARTLTASAVAGDEGISIVNGDGVSGNPTIGIDILGQTNLTTDAVDDADELLIYHSVAAGTEGLGNYAVTAAKLKTYMNAGTSTTTITEGDSSVAVSDAGSGTITTTVDSTAVITTIAASTSFNQNVIVTTGDTLTLTDLTENDVMVVGASGLVEDSAGNLTFSGTQLGVTGSIVSSTLTDNRVLLAGAAGLIEDSANFTFDGTTMQITAAANITGDLDVDNININLNTISNTSTDADLILLPNGTGSIILQNGSGEEILELNDTVSAVNGLAITAGATGVAPSITTGTGAEANIDIGFLTNGTGVLSVTAGTGNYEDNVTAADDIPNKQYVDDAVASGVGLTGNVDTITADISLAVPGTFAIGAATGIPANCTILSTIVDITTITDTAVTVTVGDATNGVASYMATTENDPQVQGIYIADNRLLNGGTARQANAVVGGVDGTVGNATIIITFRHV